MTEKRFVVENYSVRDRSIDEKYVNSSYHIGDKGIAQSLCDLLNTLYDENQSWLKTAYHLDTIAHEDRDYAKRMHKENKELKEENKELKSILQDMGLIMSNEEVKNVRDEIASKLIKPLCKGNGFDVDVNTENGFTIIPKEVNNAENKRYDVIYEKEPRGQVVTDNGIPCTARTCVTRLNWLEEENTRLKEKNKFVLGQIRAFRDDCDTYLDFDGASTLNRLLDILGEER